MVEENNNKENKPFEEKPNEDEKDLEKDMIEENVSDVSDGDENMEENVQATASEALYNELTDYIQKQIALINEKKEGKSVAKIYQNEDIVDALKFAQEYKKTRKIKEKQLTIRNYDDFSELVSQNKIISNYEINALTLNNKTIEQSVIVEYCNITKLNFQKCTFKNNVQF
ncbi:MAG: hypothetical protein K8S87_07710, partial [Planctomycetes bacterium]|nr:hypothetical protein [Planctomycetota bacterium]